MASNNNPVNIPTSHTLWSPYDTVRDVSDSLGVSSQLSDEVSKNLAMDVEYRIHEILEQAMKFMRHGKRKTLTSQDIDRAMRVLNLEPLYGYDTSRPLIFKEAMIGPGQTLYYIDDDEVDFEKLVNQPLPKVPRYTSCTAHWLAIEGVQPTIPQNPNPNEIKLLSATQRGTMDNMLSLNNEDISLTTNSKTGITTADHKSQVDKKDLGVKPLVKHVLSKELQLYFDKAVAVIMDDSNEALKTATLESIRSDPGLHQLVPYFVQFIAETITHNLKNLNLLTTMLMLIYSLLTNKSIFLDPYIHALMPCILTLLLAKKIGPTQAELEEMERHFKVRELAASLLNKIINDYGSSYNTLKPRITRTLLRAFLSNTTRTSVGTQYGAIKGMKSLGAEVIRIILVGNLKSWSNVVLENFEADDPKRQILLNEVLDCFEVLAADGKMLKLDQVTKKRKLENGDSEKMDVDLKETFSDEMKDRLKERVGDLITQEVLKKDDSVAIYNGIFFGELE